MLYLQITTVQKCMASESLPLPHPTHRGWQFGGNTVMLFLVPAKHISKAFPMDANCLALIPGWQPGHHFQCGQMNGEDWLEASLLPRLLPLTLLPFLGRYGSLDF